MAARTSAAPLAVYRMIFGALMCFSMIRFWYKGWIEELYLLPEFHFHYSLFPFIEVPGSWTYALFFICGLSAFFVAVGYTYRLSITIFFISFLYIELMDKTTYLNHYYYVSCMAFLLLCMPAGSYFSIDAWRRAERASDTVPRWCMDALKLMIVIVYFHAGLAKLNHDWLVRAMPLTLWLPAKTEMPILGSLLQHKWVHYAFSWGGAVYDLLIPLLLLMRGTRVFAFLMVVIFHVLTAVLFPIGMFPYLMIGSALIFFSVSWHERLLERFSAWASSYVSPREGGGTTASPILSVSKSSVMRGLSPYLVGVFLLFQLILPLRSHLYGGSVYWHERGYRFSWRVMLMEKTGNAQFTIRDGQSGKQFLVQNEDFLTPLQQKHMATQPDFILEYGQYLGNHFASHGHQDVEVYVDSFVAFNGRKSQRFVRKDADLMDLNYVRLINHHIIPLER